MLNWEAIGAVGEIFGALAVVVSLVYLAAQIRAQNRESRIAASHEITAAFRDTITSIQDYQRAKVMIGAMRDVDELDDTERLQFNSIAGGYLRVWEEAHYQYSEGRLEESMWQAMLNQYRDIMSIEGFQKVWATRKHTFRSEFREFIADLELGEYQLK